MSKYVGNRQAQDRGCKKDGLYLANRSTLTSHNSSLPTETHWFPSLLTPFRQQAISTDAELWQSVTSWIKTVEIGCFKSEIQALVLRWNKCLHVNGVYVPVRSVPSSTFVWCTHRIKLLASECLLPYLLEHPTSCVGSNNSDIEIEIYFILSNICMKYFNYFEAHHLSQIYVKLQYYLT
jgi:hypothetical protein